MMSGYQVSHRFGEDKPARIQTTTDYFAGAEEMPLPGEPVYTALLPFPGLVGIGTPAGMPMTSTAQWYQTPSRLDLYFPAGDDITVPLIFHDKDYPNLDLSGAWQWFSHIRTGQGPSYTLVAEFICESEYTPAEPPDVPDGFATVTLFLPRQSNWRYGDFYWDLQGLSPAPLGPPEVEPPEEDPTPGSAHTLLSGRCHITREVTTLPGEWPPSQSQPAGQGTNNFLAITVGGMKTVGPTGQVG